MRKNGCKLTTLGEIAEFTNGGAWNQTEYSAEGVPVVRVSDIKDETVDLSDCKFLPRTSLAKYEKHLLNARDLVICTVGSHPTQPGSVVGRTAIIPESAQGALLNQNAVRLRSGSPDVDQGWLGYLGRSRKFHDYIISCARGSANQVRMAIGLLKEMPVEIPALPVQRRIAGVLSAYDELIENNQRRIKILEGMARSLYREWFVSFRYPGHEKVPLIDSSLGPIPKGWEVKRIADMCESVSYGFTESASREEVGPKFLRITDIVPEIIDWDNVPYCEMSDNNVTKYLLLPGDIVVARTGATTGYAKRINKRHPTAVFASYLVRLRTKPGVSNRMLGLLMESVDYKQFIKANIGGAAQPQANAVVLSSMPLVPPSPTVAQKFDDMVEPFLDEMEVLAEKSRNLRRTRDLLLPRLLSGEVQLN